MKWVTRSHVHVDRVACPWLITRFVDNEAEFLFVPKCEIDRVVKETGAIPFDVPGVELGHHEGRCSFESTLLKYDLKEPGLVRLAQIVHLADVAEDIDKDPTRAVWKPSPRATACVFLKTWKTWHTSSRSMMPSMPGADLTLPGQGSTALVSDRLYRYFVARINPTSEKCWSRRRDCRNPTCSSIVSQADPFDILP